jgi:hypothetical protein
MELPAWISQAPHCCRPLTAASRSIADKAQQNQHQSDSEKAVVRAQLSEQLNRILATRDSARGSLSACPMFCLTPEMYSLKPGAREKLAKVAGKY